MAELDKLAGGYHKFDGTGDAAGLNQWIKDNNLSPKDLADLSGLYESDWEKWFKNSGLPSYDIGTNFVPRDTLAMVHQGEAIVPKAFNPWAGGGGAAGIWPPRSARYGLRPCKTERSAGSRPARLCASMRRSHGCCSAGTAMDCRIRERRQLHELFIAHRCGAVGRDSSHAGVHQRARDGLSRVGGRHDICEGPAGDPRCSAQGLRERGGRQHGEQPATPPDEPKWLEVGPTNRWKPFDKSVSSQVKQANSITYRIKPSQAITSLGLLNVAGATSIRVRLIDPTYGTVYDKTTSMAAVPVATGWWEWYFGERLAPTQALLQDLPSFPMADILIDIAGTAALAVGVILMGQRRVLPWA